MGRWDMTDPAASMTVTPSFESATLMLGLSPEQQKQAFMHWVDAVVTENEQVMLSAYPRQQQPHGGKPWAQVTEKYASWKEDLGYNADEIGTMTGRMRNSLFHTIDYKKIQGSVGYPEFGDSKSPKYPMYFNARRKLLPVASKTKIKAVGLFWKMMQNQRTSGLAFQNGAALRGVGI